MRDSRRCRQVPARFQGPVPEQELRPALLTPQEREPAQALPQLLPQALMPVKEPVRLMLRGQLRQERRRRAFFGEKAKRRITVMSKPARPEGADLMFRRPFVTIS